MITVEHAYLVLYNVEMRFRNLMKLILYLLYVDKIISCRKVVPACDYCLTRI